jgi:lipopolysaccharide exporter
MPNAGPSADETRVYRGAAVAVLLQWSMRLVGLVSVVLLARILAPADFGIVGLAAAALALVELLGAIGLRQALLRIQEPEREHLDTAFTLQLILFSGMAVAGLASAPVMGALYGEPALTAVVAALACRYFILGLVNIGVVEFDRNLEFGRDLRMRLCSRLAALAVTVAVAVLLRSYWALVIGLICQSGFLMIASWIAHPYRPRLSLARRSELLGISIWMFVHNLAQTVQQQVERLALGRFGSAHLLGLYSVSKDLSDIFTQEISTALNRVTFVTVARSGGPLSEMPERVPRLLGAYAMIAAPLGLGLVATSHDAIAVLLGSQWIEAAPVLEVVAIYSALFAVYRVIASSLMASGRASTAASLSGAGALFLILAVGLISHARPEVMAVAWAAFAGNAGMLLAGIVLMSREARSPLLPLVASVMRPFTAAALMLVTVRMSAPNSGLPLVDLIAGVTIGAVVYPLFLFALWFVFARPTGAEEEAVKVAGGLWRRLAVRFG